MGSARTLGSSVCSIRPLAIDRPTNIRLTTSAGDETRSTAAPGTDSSLAPLPARERRRFLPKLVRHAGEHDARLEQEEALQEQGTLIVKLVMATLGPDQLGEEDPGHTSGGRRD